MFRVRHDVVGLFASCALGLACGDSFAPDGAAGAGGAGGAGGGGSGGVGPPPIQPGEVFLLSGDANAGNDEDPTTLVALDGSLHAAFISNRNGEHANGVEDVQLFHTWSEDGRAWSDPAALTEGDGWAWFPSLAQSEDGAFHLAWWRVDWKPAGCVPGVDCTQGNENRILYKSSPDGVTWDAGEELEVTQGPGDMLPTMVYDRVGGRLLVYFTAVVRNAEAEVDFSDWTLRVFVVIRDESGWSQPLPLTSINVDTEHSTFPHVAQRDDGTFVMAWTRYDATEPSGVLDVLASSSADIYVSTSVDGLAWDEPVLLSDGATATDAMPHVFADHDGGWFVTWRTTAFSSRGSQVETAIPGPGPFELTERPVIEGYSGRVLATHTPGVFWGAWVGGEAPLRNIEGRFFSR